MLAKNWKLLAVLGVFIWSVVNLFQIVTADQLKYYDDLAAKTPQELQDYIGQRLMQVKNWDKLTEFQREEIRKQLNEEAQFANNLQVLGHFSVPKGMPQAGDYDLITNLKLGLDLRGGSQLLL